jgi:hypothetical protein
LECGQLRIEDHIVPGKFLQHADLVFRVLADFHQTLSSRRGLRELDCLNVFGDQHRGELPDSGALLQRSDIAAIERKEIERFFENVLEL